MNSTEPITTDAYLDAIERTLGTRTEVECPRCEGSGEGPDLSDCSLCLGNCAVAANSAEAMESLARFLIARVRAAEAERDAARKAALTEALDAVAESAPSMEEEHQQAHAAYMAVGVLLGADFPFPALRTLETAEEWEYAWTDADGVLHEERNPERAFVCAQAAGGKFLRARPRAWETFREPVPPTPETEESGRG